MISRRFTSLFAVSALLLAACSGSQTRLRNGKTLEGEVVEAEGQAPYNGSDLAATRAAALAAAQRAAVELVVGVYVSGKTKVDKAVAVESNILSKSEGLIKRYEVLSEGRSGDWYKMRIRALVATKDIHEQLENMGLIRSPALGNPRVAILLQEYVGEKEETSRPATQALTRALLEKGFKVVEPPASLRSQEDSAEAARTLSRNVAEVLITGLARAQSLGLDKSLGGMSSFRVNVSLRVLESGTGEVLTTVSQTASGLEGTREIAGAKALQEAAKLAANDLVTLPRELTSRAHAEMTISGLTSFEALSNFQKGLAKTNGVRDLYLRSFEQEKGVAVLDILTDQITPQELADQSVRLGGSAWSVFQVTGRSIQLSASQAGR